MRFVLLTAIFSCLFLIACDLKINEAELAILAGKAHPGWENYQEDIKAQIGATPVAQWRGTPRHAWKDGDGIHVQFDIEDAWKKRTCVIPILIRDSGGTEYLSTKGLVEEGKVTYTFPPSSSLSVFTNTIEIKYPHEDRRLELEPSTPLK